MNNFVIDETNNLLPDYKAEIEKWHGTEWAQLLNITADGIRETWRLFRNKDIPNIVFWEEFMKNEVAAERLRVVAKQKGNNWTVDDLLNVPQHIVDRAIAEKIHDYKQQQASPVPREKQLQYFKNIYGVRKLCRLGPPKIKMSLWDKLMWLMFDREPKKIWI